MKASSVFNEKVIKDICKASGSPSLAKEASFFGCQHFRTPPPKFWCEIFDESAFYVAGVGREHLRLYGIAVKKELQGKGIGRAMFTRLAGRARAAGLKKITFRTNMYEDAQHFYSHLGAKVVGLKDNDIEMIYEL